MSNPLKHHKNDGKGLKTTPKKTFFVQNETFWLKHLPKKIQFDDESNLVVGFDTDHHPNQGVERVMQILKFMPL